MTASNRRRTTVGIVSFHRPEPLGALLDALAGAELDVVVVNVGADHRVRAVADTRHGVRVVDM